MTEKIMKDQHSDMLQFYRDQLIRQSDQLAAQVRQLTNGQVVNHLFHDALNKALYTLSDIQGLNHPHGDDFPFYG